MVNETLRRYLLFMVVNFNVPFLHDQAKNSRCVSLTFCVFGRTPRRWTGSRRGYTLRHEQEGTQLSGTASGAIFQCLCPKLHSWGVSPSLSLPSPLKKEFFSLLLLKQQLGSSAWGRVALQNCFASFLAGHLFFCSSRPLDRAVPQLLLLLTL